MRKYEAAPHPFVIEPPLGRKKVYKPGEMLDFGLVLIGRAIDYLPYFIYTFDELGKTGLGKGRGKFELKAVRSRGSGIGDRGSGMTSETIYDDITKTLKQFEITNIGLDPNVKRTRKKTTLALRFLTPTRIIYNNRLTLELEFHILLRNLLRRISLIHYFHSNEGQALFDFAGLIKKAEGVKVLTSNLHWYDWERYSGRQERKINMGGFVGDITFEGVLEPFIPLIRAGEILHVGKGTAFGLGKYEV